MNKAVSWNINGVGFDAREAAREAARRQGKSLGEWLHGVIADRASELGTDDPSLGTRDRVDAVTTKLERMSARSAAFSRRMQAEDVDDEPRGRDFDTRDYPRAERSERRRTPDDAYEARRRHPSAPSIEETEFLLEGAVDAMERRARRSERRADDALASITRMLESNETRRDSERDAVTALARKLSDIESRLVERPVNTDQSPIKGALARLEARLELIGRRSTAEASLRPHISPLADKSAVGPDNSVQRLEDKLNSILEAVTERPLDRASSLALLAAQQPVSGTPHRLGEAIAAISRRQSELDGESPATPRPGPLPAVLRRTRNFDQVSQPLSAVQREIASLASKIEDFRGELTQSRVPAKDPGLDALRLEVATISRTLHDLAPRDSIQALETAVRTLTSKAESVRGQSVPKVDLGPVEAVMADLRRTLVEIDPRKTIAPLEKQVRSIADKVDSLAKAELEPTSFARLQEQIAEVRDLVAAAASRSLDGEEISRRVTALTDRIDVSDDRPLFTRNLAEAADQIRAMIAEGPGTAALTKIEGRLDSLAKKVDAALSRPMLAGTADPALDFGSLHGLVRDLGAKMEAVQTNGSDGRSLDALQQQIERLSTRFERTEGSFAALPTLERSMKELFAHLDETRAGIEASAAAAAHEALRVALADGNGHRGQAASQDLVALAALQEDADARTRSTLGAVHETLEKVVDRLAMMEGDIAEVRELSRTPQVRASEPAERQVRRPDAPQPDVRRSAAAKVPDASLLAADPLLDSYFKEPQGRRAPPNAEVKAKSSPTGGADYIAAARRAAQAAQADPAVMALKRPVPVDAKEPRAGLIAKSRDYVASHKRPVLLGMAAILVVLGTLAMMHRLGLEPADSLVAARDASAKVAALSNTADSNRVDNPADADALTPSALPKSDPSTAPVASSTGQGPTASVPNLPSFAAQAAGTAAAAPSLPTGLKSMAEAGDTSAAFELGARYAEGKGIARDLKLAAQWYQKAADAGSAPAQYRLASLYEKGLGVPQDKEHAKSLYTEAADAGNPRAMHNLAVLLADGGGKPDYEGAATWFRKAAQYGVHDSQYNLAILLARGLGVRQSLVQSYQWFAIAAAQNDVDAAQKRDEVGGKMNSNDLAVAKALATSFHPKTADLAAIEVQPPPGGWDSAPLPSHLNSARAKVSSL